MHICMHVSSQIKKEKLSKRYILARRRLDVRRKYIDTVGELSSNSNLLSSLNRAGIGALYLASGDGAVSNGNISSSHVGKDALNAENGSTLSTKEVGAEETGTGILPLTTSADIVDHANIVLIDSGSRVNNDCAMEELEKMPTSNRQSNKTEVGGRSSGNSISSLLSRIPKLPSSPAVSNADHRMMDEHQVSDAAAATSKRSKSSNVDHNRSIINSYSSCSSSSNSGSAFELAMSQILKPMSGGQHPRERANIFKGTCAEHPDQNLRGNGRGYCVRCASEGVRVKRPRTGGKARSAADGLDGYADDFSGDDEYPDGAMMRDSHDGNDFGASADGGAVRLAASRLAEDRPTPTLVQPVDSLLSLSAPSSNQLQVEKLGPNANVGTVDSNAVEDDDDSSDARRRCEACHKKHDGLFGSGRFCDISCRAKFAAAQPANPNNRYAHSKGDKHTGDTSSSSASSSSTAAADGAPGANGNHSSAKSGKSGPGKKPRSNSTGSAKKKGARGANSGKRIRWGKEKKRPFAAVQWAIEFAQICNITNSSSSSNSSGSGSTSSVAGNGLDISNNTNSSNSGNNNKSSNHTNAFLSSLPLASLSSSSSTTLPYLGGAGGFPGVVSIPSRKLIASSFAGAQAAGFDGTSAMASLARSPSNGSNTNNGNAPSSGILGGDFGESRMIAPYFVQQVYYTGSS